MCMCMKLVFREINNRNMVIGYKPRVMIDSSMLCLFDMHASMYNYVDVKMRGLN